MMRRAAFLTGPLSPAAGGVHYVVHALSKSLQSLDFDIQVFGSIDSHFDENTWRNIKIRPCKVSGPKSFGYQHELLKAVSLFSPDIIHAHGIWMYPSLAASIIANRYKKPYVISPHGMLDEWAMNNSKYKKIAAMYLYEKNNLSNANCIHALCESEYLSIRRLGFKNPIAVIPNGVDFLTGYEKYSFNKDLKNNSNIRTLLYFGRIHPKKGIYELLDAWASLPDIKWKLLIAGWGADQHIQQMKNKIFDNKISDSVSFIGPQFGPDKSKTFSMADMFILPSHSEGLPMTVLEAWSYGIPVIMTPQCNIPQGFATEAAISIDPQVESIKKCLSHINQISDKSLKEMGCNGTKLIKNIFSWNVVSKDLSSVYNWILADGLRPSCVILD